MQSAPDTELKFPVAYTGAALDIMKIIAAVFMVFDHLAYADMVSQDFHITIGRGVFPVFAYALGCFLAGPHPDIKKYAGKMGIYAVLTQPVYYFLVGMTREGYMMMNALVTFFIAALVGYILLHKNINSILKHSIIISLIVFGNVPLPIEYYVSGIVLPILFAMAIRGEKSALFYLPAAFVMLNAFYPEFHNPHWYAVVSTKAFFSAAVFWLIYNSAPIIASSLKIGKRFLPSHFLYIFYPLHILVIVFAKMF